MHFLEYENFDSIEQFMCVSERVGCMKKYITTSTVHYLPEIAAKQQKEINHRWNEMKQINAKAFLLLQQQHGSDDHVKDCIIPIISNIKPGNAITAYAMSALITLSTKRTGSPWHTHDLSDLILTNGQTANIASITNSDDPSNAISNMIHTNQNAEHLYRKNALHKSGARYSWRENSISSRTQHTNHLNVTSRPSGHINLNMNNAQQHVDNFHYKAMQLILQRAKDQNVSAEQFSTWSLVFMFDKDDSSSEDIDKLWHGDLWRPYQKIQQMITEWKSDMHYSTEYHDPTLIFYCLDGQIEEKHCHGIPIERDERPGIILLSGNGVTAVQEIIEICCKHRKQPRAGEDQDGFPARGKWRGSTHDGSGACIW
jgi:hypothetical protein